MTAAAVLDPVSGLIRGYAWAGRDRPETVELLVGGCPSARVVAGAPAASLARLPGLAADLPAEGCSFALAVPRCARAPVEIALRMVGEDGIFFAHRFATARDLAVFTEGSRVAERFAVEIDGLRDGTLSGRVTGPAGAPPPALALVCAGHEIAPAHVDAATGGGPRCFRADLPASAMNDGVRTIEVIERSTGEVLARYPIAAGQALAGDLVAEIAALRAELDELRRALFAAFADPPLPASERPLLLAELLDHVEAVLGVQDARIEAEIAGLRRLVAGRSGEGG